MSIFTGAFKKKAAPYALAVGLGLAGGLSVVFDAAAQDISENTTSSVTPAYDGALESVAPEKLLFNPSYYLTGRSPHSAAQAIFKATAQSPLSALAYADRYGPFVLEARHDELADALLAAIVRMPWDALAYTDRYGPFVPEARHDELADALFAAMKQNPWYALASADRYGPFVPEARYDELVDALFAAMAQRPWDALAYADRYAPFVPEARHDELADALFVAMVRMPWNALAYADRYAPFVPEARHDELVDALFAIMVQKPLSALRYAARYGPLVPEARLAPALERTAQQLLASLRGVRTGFSSEQRAYLTPYIGKETIDILEQIEHQREASQRTGRRLNDLHNEPDSVRFASVAGASAAELFSLMIFGREELYTSSYLGVFKRFTDRLAREGHSDIYAAFDPRLKAAPRVFLDMAAEYGTINHAVAMIPAERWEDVFSLYASGMESGEASNLIALAEIMHVMPDENVKRRMKAFLQQKYNTAPDPELRDIYGMAAAYYNSIAGEEAVRITDPARYRIGSFDRLPQKSAFGADGIHRQLFVFTGDTDGHASFAHFLARYRNNEKYILEEKKAYIKITSATGHPVEIYANRPGASPDTIIDLLAGHKNASVEDVEIDAVIHRGHSYNLKNTMPYFSRHNSFIFLGSCGGFRNIERLMKITPDVQIASTKQTGTMFVNDPLLYEITEQIRKKGFVDWSQQQAYLESLSNPDKSHYVLPHKNVAQMINARLRKLAEQRKAQQHAQRPPVVMPASMHFPESI